jgi:hypothetical protein
MLRRILIGLLMLAWSSASFAVDPLTLILLRLVRDQIIASSAQSAIEGMQREDESRKVIVLPPAPYVLEDSKLRALIDEGFVYLTPAQRDEVYVSVRRALGDPKNAALRPMIVQELALKASAVRQAHEKLENLSEDEKNAIVSQARGEYVELPPAERRQMIQVLQSGIAPIPRELNERMLAAFGGVQSAAAEPDKIP